MRGRVPSSRFAVVLTASSIAIALMVPSSFAVPAGFRGAMQPLSVERAVPSSRSLALRDLTPIQRAALGGRVLVAAGKSYTAAKIDAQRYVDHHADASAPREG